MTKSNPLLRLAAAACAIVAIALAAATVQSPLETGSGGDSGTGGGGNGAGQPAPPEQPTDGAVPPFLEYLFYVLLVVVALAVVWYLVAHRRDAVKWIAAGLVVLVVLFGLASVLPDLFPSSAGSEVMNGTNSSLEEGSESGGDGSLVSPGPVLAVLGLITAIFLAGVFLTRGSNESDATGEAAADAGDGPMDDEAAAAVGTAAGEAAARLEDDEDVDNAIYRAWREMTDPLEVERPDSSTPREFARAATDAGMDRDDVEELTRLFEDVRYGDAPTTDEREARAVAVLRRIEAAYADDLDADDATARGGRS